MENRVLAPHPNSNASLTLELNVVSQRCFENVHVTTRDGLGGKTGKMHVMQKRKTVVQAESKLMQESNR